MQNSGQSPPDFPSYPVSWYLFGRSSELRRKLHSRDIFGQRVVVFRKSDGSLTALNARCSHLGADLGRGCVVGDAIQCPFHQWEYDASGRCVRIPVAVEIPPTARQTTYPVIERHGFVFVFNGAEPNFDMPFFAGEDPKDFVAARPFGTVLDCPWYMIGANAFDLQHFRAAHDRYLVGDPKVDCPDQFARRATGRFRVSGNSLQDRVTRLVAGNEVEMSITDWCGNMMFATATFRRTRSNGMVITQPLGPNSVLVRVIVFVRRSRWALGRILRDPLHGAIRRQFIKRFLSADAARLEGVRFNPQGLIPFDRDLADYFRWLAVVSRGQTWPGDNLEVSRSNSHGAR